jgi:hypothetical protein
MVLTAFLILVHQMRGGNGEVGSGKAPEEEAEYEQRQEEAS